MSGHSKWSTIKRKKAKEDAKRGKIFTRLIREITVVAREGGGDPAANARLRLLVDKAKIANMPQDNITKAIKRGTGEIQGAQYAAAMYEGYGPHGVAVLIETLTDNKTRTVAAVRHYFSKKGGHIAEGGAVAWMFKHLGVVTVKAAGHTEDEALEKLLEYGIEDVKSSDDVILIECDIQDLDTVRKAAEGAGFEVESVDLIWEPKDEVPLDGGHEEQVHTFLDGLEDLDDVQNVYANID
jgi:YebC/PmpR family DNA-binding regulatory protein